jgi:hypothetical protein
MTDIGTFIFGCCVFGLALAATVAATIGTSQSRTRDGESLKNDAKGVRSSSEQECVMRGSQ